MDKQELRSIGRRAETVGRDRQIRDVVRGAERKTIIDYWPYAALGAILLIVVVAVVV